MPYKDKTNAEYLREYRKLNRDKTNEKQRQYRYDNGSQPMSENKTCSLFLGVHIAEKMLSRIFKNVERSPYGTSGYDFRCGKDYLIDVKSSCSQVNSFGTKRWHFTIKRNIIADYFLCIAFDNRQNLNPLHLWLIPGSMVSYFSGITISETTLYKWSQYKKPIDKAVSCCNQMKNSD